jgi:AcrR family transcriptional regulator
MASPRHSTHIINGTVPYMNSSTGPKHRGRPLDQTKEAAILSAAREAIARGGYEGTSVDEVARGAGTSKLTIYRRYPSKASLAVAVIEAMGRRMTVPQRNSDPKLNLVRHLEFFRSESERLAVVPMLAAAITEQVRIPSLLEALRHHYLNPTLELLTESVELATRAGITAGAEAADVARRLAADFYFNEIYGRQTLDWPNEALDRIVFDG